MLHEAPIPTMWRAFMQNIEECSGGFRLVVVLTIGLLCVSCAGQGSTATETTIMVEVGEPFVYPSVEALASKSDAVVIGVVNGEPTGYKSVGFEDAALTEIAEGSESPSLMYQLEVETSFTEGFEAKTVFVSRDDVRSIEGSGKYTSEEPMTLFADGERLLLFLFGFRSAPQPYLQEAMPDIPDIVYHAHGDQGVFDVRGDTVVNRSEYVTSLRGFEVPPADELPAELPIELPLARVRNVVESSG